MIKLTELKDKNFERVVHLNDPTVGLNAFVAIHNTNLGPALGGCRAMEYPEIKDSIADAKNLAEGMTYKAALANMPLGGGKAVIKLEEGMPLTDDMLKSFGDGLNEINKHGVMYYTAGDVGTGPRHLEILSKYTEFVNGVGSTDSGVATAYGVLQGIRGALRFSGREIWDQTVAMAGFGKVGRRLANFLINEEAMVIAADPFAGDHDIPIEAHKLGKASFTNVHSMGTLFAPCAVGGAINEKTVEEIPRGNIICGGANNQIASPELYARMLERDLIYVPDFVANAGGIIIINANNKNQDLEYDDPLVILRLDDIKYRTWDILELAKESKRHPEKVAVELAKEIVNNGR